MAPRRTHSTYHRVRKFCRAEGKGLLRNLRSGLPLLLFHKRRFSAFRINYDQAVLLALLGVAVNICVGYAKNLPAPVFNIYAFWGKAIALCGILLAAYLIAKSLGDDRATLKLLVPIFSVAPPFSLVWAAVELANRYLFAGMYAVWYVIYYSYVAWALAVVGLIVYQLSPRKKLRALTHFGIYLALVVGPALLLSMGEFWYPRPAATNSALASFPRVNVEKTYYAQTRLIARTEAELSRQRPHVVDLYFVGFAGYASQDVFMHEVRYAKQLFDKRFDTRGRSAILINNPKTLNDVPLASSSNLTLLLAHVGRILDPEEDILFLFLTSHGSKDHRLSVNYPLLGLNQIKPADLKRMLDDAGIKWRVLMISSCYSGGFVEELKDEYTMIATAAAQDQQSFGCGHENKFTYFGQAVLAEQLANGKSFRVAFEKAAESIRQRELAEHLTPSRPQLFIGKQIETKLRALERRLQESNLAVKVSQ